MAHFILAMDWTDPKIFGPLLAAGGAVIGALITGFFTVWGKKKADQPSVKQEQSQHMHLGLDEMGVGRELENKLTPVREKLASIEQQLSPKMPPSESADPLKAKAVELYNQGVQLQEAGDEATAIRKYYAAIELDPDFAYAHNNLGVVLKAKGDLDAAISEYREALRIKPDHAYAHGNLGLALMAKGKLEPAISGFREVLRIDPNDAGGYYGLACAFALGRNPREAMLNLERAIELDEGDRERAKTDADFDRIRDDPAFRKLVYGE